ncbi:MAG: gamma-glutamyltransferase [Phycisphaerales bacterium]|nr:gamma-glutamyltransferase [Phycisphaerales bacterium]
MTIHRTNPVHPRPTGRPPVQVGVLACVLAAITILLPARTHAQVKGFEFQKGFAQVFENGAVAADHSIASQAGAEILRAGGNAVDAAVATSLALSVVRPYSCGIGGGGFMIVHLVDHPTHPPIDIAINYREQCPGAYMSDYYEKCDLAGLGEHTSTHGGRAVAIPGTVAGLLHALERYGTMTRAQVFAPAIRAAEEGFLVDEHYATSIREPEVMGFLKDRPDRQAQFSFIWNRFLSRGEIKVGDRVRLPEQAEALRLIARDGRDAFYKGPIAESIVKAVRLAGGEMTLADLENFKVAEAEPLRAEFMGRRLMMMPPPSSGGIAVAQVFEMLELRPELTRSGLNSTPYIHAVTEALKHAFADRARYVADPAFVPVPTDSLLAPGYIRSLASRIDPSRTLEASQYGGQEPVDQLPEDHGTSHLCVVDSKGNAVACTETINLIFGSLVCAEPFGFILNNEMDDFVTRRGTANAFGLVESEKNMPSPGKRPLSCMSPIIAVDEKGVALVAGAAGGPRIITSTVQVALNVLQWNLPAEQAMLMPRFHHQWTPNTLQMEASLRGGATAQELAKLGHEVTTRKAVGNAQLIRRAKDTKGYEAACDPRKGGLPAGH